MAPNLLGSSAGLFLTAEAAIGRESEQQQQQQQQQQQKQQQITKSTQQQPAKKKQEQPYKHNELVWRNILAFIYLHAGALYGLFMVFFGAKLYTSLFALSFGSAGALGITAGAHRLWAHRSYKADWRMRSILTVLQTMAFQNHVYEWVRDHRVHHKFTDTDADPHNSQRGFFFSHIGWLMVKKHPDVKIKGATIDMSDLERDPIVMFQKKYYLFIMPVFCFMIPTLIPWYFWSENFWTSFYVAAVFRYTLSLNMTWLVNSAAHIWGTRPYDTAISPTENVFVGYTAMGEGWHNYHHVFPWDYKAAELGNYHRNLTTGFIDFFARLGWAYDLKTVSVDMIRKRVNRTGDGTHAMFHKFNRSGSAPGADESLTEAEIDRMRLDAEEESRHHSHEGQIWGWDDKDMTEDDRKVAQVVNRRYEGIERDVSVMKNR